MDDHDLRIPSVVFPVQLPCVGRSPEVGTEENMLLNKSAGSGSVRGIVARADDELSGVEDELDGDAVDVVML